MYLRKIQIYKFYINLIEYDTEREIKVLVSHNFSFIFKYNMRQKFKEMRYNT